MSQGIIPIAAGGDGATVRGRLNAALQRLQTKGSGTARPTDIVAYEDWIDTDTPGAGVVTWYLYDGTTDISLGTFNTTTHVWTPAGVSGYVSVPGGFVNVLRNGTFLSWPKGTSAISIAAAATGSGAIAANGWAVLATGATVTAARDTGNGGSLYSLKITGAASVTAVTVGQRIEAANGAAIASKRVTFQAWVYNSTGGSITPTIATRYAGAADDWTTPVADLAAANLQACADGAWTQVAYTFDAHANAANGYEVKIAFGNNFSTNAKYVRMSSADLRYTAGVSTGLNASPPTPELPAARYEMARNARYYQTSYSNGVTPASVTAVGLVNAGSQTTNGYGMGFQLPVEMRAAGTFLYWDGAGNASKVSYYAASAWVDNAAGFSAVVSTGPKSVIVAEGATVAISNFIHFSNYADFW